MKRAALIGLCLLAAPSARGQESLITAEVDAARIGLEDDLLLTVRLSGDASGAIGSVQLPSIPNLTLVGGPSTSQQTTIVNGAVSRSTSLTYAFRPTATGTIRIGSVRLEFAGKTHASQPLSVEVVPGRVKPQRQVRRGPFADFFDAPSRRQRQQQEARVLIRAEPSRKRLYVGEPLLLNFNLYTQTSITDMGTVDAPQFPGFWSERLEQPDWPRGGKPATIDGESYRYFPITPRLLVPTRAGQLEIPASTFRLGIASGGFFQRNSNIERTVQPVTIEVLPLPEAPGFRGAVGQFRSSATLDKTRIELGDAATLRFRIEGRGNLKWIDEAPDIEIPGVQVYPPQEKSAIRVDSSGFRGSRDWEFVLVPEIAGELEIPSLELAYFDPKTERIERSRTESLRLEVAGAPGARIAGPGPVAGVAPRNGFPLRAGLERPARRLPVLSGRAVAISLGVWVLLHVGLYGFPRLADGWRRRTGHQAPRQSVSHALSNLKRARRDEMTKEAAAALIEKSMHDLFGPLTDSAHDGERERAARALLEEVQLIRYAPQLGDYTEQIHDVAQRAATLVRKWA